MGGNPKRTNVLKFLVTSTNTLLQTLPACCVFFYFFLEWYMNAPFLGINDGLVAIVVYAVRECILLNIDSYNRNLMYKKIPAHPKTSGDCSIMDWTISEYKSYFPILKTQTVSTIRLKWSTHLSKLFGKSENNFFNIILLRICHLLEFHVGYVLCFIRSVGICTSILWRTFLLCLRLCLIHFLASCLPSTI